MIAPTTTIIMAQDTNASPQHRDSAGKPACRGFAATTRMLSAERSSPWITRSKGFGRNSADDDAMMMALLMMAPNLTAVSYMTRI